MDDLVPFLGIAGAVALGAMAPGPSFVFVARTAIAATRSDGLAAALGMGVGGVTFAALALLGLQAVLSQVAWLYAGFKIAGGLYLLYLAFRLWRGAADPVRLPASAPRDGGSVGTSFAQGLATQLSNPKAAIAYASIFAALLPPSPPLWLVLALPPVILLIETGWYAIVALAFSAGRPRAFYLRAKRWIDRVTGTVIGLLGARLILDAAHSS